MSAEETEYILVAEDSSPNRSILVHFLKKLRFGVVECSDGQVAWDFLNENSDKNIVAIMSDVMMPNMDGLQLLNLCRDDEKLNQIPFVLITAVSEKDTIIEAKELKVDGYVLKPVTSEKLLTKLQALFPERKFRTAA